MSFPSDKAGGKRNATLKPGGFLAKTLLLLIIVTPVVGVFTTPTIRFEVSIEKPAVIEVQLNNLTVFFRPVTDIMSLREFFKLHPILEPAVTILLLTGLLLFTLTFIQTWNLASLTKGELWEDWKYTVYGVASLLYAGYVTLICLLWGSLNSNYSIFNSPVFIIPVISSLISTPVFLFLSFYRFRKKVELFVKAME